MLILYFRFKLRFNLKTWKQKFFYSLFDWNICLRDYCQICIGGEGIAYYFQFHFHCYSLLLFITKFWRKNPSPIEHCWKHCPHSLHYRKWFPKYWPTIFNSTTIRFINEEQYKKDFPKFKYACQIISNDYSFHMIA